MEAKRINPEMRQENRKQKSVGNKGDYKKDGYRGKSSSRGDNATSGTGKDRFEKRADGKNSRQQGEKDSWGGKQEGHQKRNRNRDAEEGGKKRGPENQRGRENWQNKDGNKDKVREKKWQGEREHRAGAGKQEHQGENKGKGKGQSWSSEKQRRSSFDRQDWKSENGDKDRVRDRGQREERNGKGEKDRRSSAGGQNWQSNKGKSTAGKGRERVEKFAGKDEQQVKNIKFESERVRIPKSNEGFKGKRKNSRCKVSGECGGCKMIDVPYDEQLMQKEKETAALLKPFMKLEGIIGMENPEHYRNKVSAAFTHDRKGKPLSGVYKEGTHYIIPVEECLLENKKADEIIGSIRELLPSFKIKTYDEDTDYGLLRHVMVRVGHTSGQIMVVLVLSSPIMPSKNNFVKALLKLQPEITTIVINTNDRKTSMVLGDKEQVIYGKGYIEDTLNGKIFKISPKSFYQVNSVQTEKLYGKAIEYAGLTGKETVLDAYCGIGTIGIMAADRAKQVIGVELNKDAVKDAVINAKQNQISNIQFYQKDAGEFMTQLAEQETQIDTVFMDPPRAGSDEVFLNSLAMLKPKKIVYISCNPETLARDREYLTKKGYKAEKGVAVDMFPFTNHVETCVLLSHKNS